MNRKEFVMRCAACVGITGFGLMTGCAGTKYIDATIDGSDLMIPANAFEVVEKDGSKKTLTYVVAQNNKLEYPVSVFRFSENDYSALLMRCTHQGTELQVFGDRLQCPAHGSEFNNRGVVKNGPADANLRMFPVKLVDNTIRVNLS
jgi:Rieske Fe-S protein